MPQLVKNIDEPLFQDEDLIRRLKKYSCARLVTSENFKWNQDPSEIAGRYIFEKLQEKNMDIEHLRDE